MVRIGGRGGGVVQTASRRPGGVICGARRRLRLLFERFRSHYRALAPEFRGGDAGDRRKNAQRYRGFVYYIKILVIFISVILT
jgi:hypothetical protein